MLTIAPSELLMMTQLLFAVADEPLPVAPSPPAPLVPPQTMVVPEPLASVVRHVLRQDDWGDLWQCVKEKQQWQLIDVPETVAAK